MSDPTDTPPPETEPPALSHQPRREDPAVRARARATSYVTAPPSPVEPCDPLLSFTPVPHKAPRRNSITPDLQRTFIATLAATGIVTQAARAIGRSMEAIYKLRQRPGAEEFRAAWDMAIDRGVARLEDCAPYSLFSASASALAISSLPPVAAGGQSPLPRLRLGCREPKRAEGPQARLRVAPYGAVAK